MTVKDNTPADVEDSAAEEFDSEVGLIGEPVKLKAYSKFIVAAVGLAVTLGVLDPGLEQNVAGLLTAVGVFLFPNEQ